MYFSKLWWDKIRLGTELFDRPVESKYKSINIFASIKILIENISTFNVNGQTINY